MSPATGKTFLLILPIDCSLSSNGQTLVKRTSWRHNLELWSLSSSRMMAMRIVYQVWSSLAFPFRRYGWFYVTTSIGLVTLTFDLLITGWGHGSPVSCASILSIFSFLGPSVSRLRVMHVTDRQTKRWTDKPYGNNLQTKLQDSCSKSHLTFYIYPWI